MSDGGRGYGYEPDEEDDYYTYDATDDDDDGRRKPIVILAIVALIVVFAGVVFLAYKQGLKQGAQGNPPVIRADDTPAKVAPADPGGKEFPHQDKTVYDRISGGEDATGDADVEHLLPRPEEPMAVAPKPVEPEPAPNPAPAPALEDQVPPVAAVPPQAAAPAPEMPSLAVTTAGDYVVQLAAFRDEPSAQGAFAKLRSKHPALSALTSDIQRADLGAKGIYYRLRAGYMDKAGAAALCTALKAEGQACLVKPR